MAKYIDCDYVTSKLEKHYRDRRDIAFDLDSILFMLEKCPAADVVEVVMCEKCKHCEFGYPEKRINEQAKEGYYCRLEKRYKDPNFYCSYGERKEGAENDRANPLVSSRTENQQQSKAKLGKCFSEVVQQGSTRRN